MTTIIEKDGRVVHGYVLEQKVEPIPYLRLRVFEKIGEVSNPIPGVRGDRFGFGTELIFVDDIQSIHGATGARVN